MSLHLNSNWWRQLNQMEQSWHVDIKASCPTSVFHILSTSAPPVSVLTIRVPDQVQQLVAAADAVRAVSVCCHQGFLPNKPFFMWYLHLTNQAKPQHACS